MQPHSSPHVFQKLVFKGVLPLTNNIIIDQRKEQSQYFSFQQLTITTITEVNGMISKDSL